jgi:hypothetical protein
MVLGEFWRNMLALLADICITNDKNQQPALSCYLILKDVLDECQILKSQSPAS